MQERHAFAFRVCRRIRLRSCAANINHASIEACSRRSVFACHGHALTDLPQLFCESFAQFLSPSDNQPVVAMQNFLTIDQRLWPPFEVIEVTLKGFARGSLA